MCGENFESKVRLLCKSELEPVFWLNEYVHTGYREPHQPKSVYVRSVLEWNNETINIWSHLLGFIYFSWLFYDANFNTLPQFDAFPSDHIVISICIIGAQICMFLSAAYHMFGCASADERRRWLRFDQCGISAGLISIYLSGIYTAFQCFENWRTNYITVALGLFAFVLYIPSRSGIMDSKLFGTRVGYLHLIYMCVALFGMLPTVHWFSLHGGFENPHVVSWLPNIFILYTLIGFAFIFYVTMIPERLVPGKFDVLGCSHQWWHLFILIAMIFWQSRGIQFLSVVRSMPKFCSDVATVRNLTSSTTFNLTTPQHEFSVY